MKELTFYEKIRNYYEKTKKAITIILVFFTAILEFLPTQIFDFFQPEVTQSVKAGLIFTLLVILLQLLFDIHKQLREHLNEIKPITSNQLLQEIGELVSNYSTINIQYVGVAGRHGWFTVINKLLEEGSEFSVLNRKVIIDIALISQEIKDEINSGTNRYSSIDTVTSEIGRLKSIYKKKGKDIEINLYRYDHMPNFIGFLVNGNFLFSSFAYWEKQDSDWILRGGGTDYIVYDKNDNFGGDYYIKRFEKWFEYIKSKSEMHSSSSEKNSVLEEEAR